MKGGKKIMEQITEKRRAHRNKPKESSRNLKSAGRNKRGNVDVNSAINLALSLIFGAIVLAVGLFTISVIFGLSIFRGEAGGMNLSTNVSYMTNQISALIMNFFTLLPTVGTILGVVLLISGILLLVFKVMAMRETTRDRMTG